ncbi:hypothetical protein ACQCSU_11655 [Pseudarthrobacter sp. O4]|uniref:hypothetical protein n=1 Tax=Pseudarthrobacter sp. O4 TaxID=3418417 RepID=UPI003CF88443
MNPLLHAVARVGTSWDNVIAAGASTPRKVLAALAVRRDRRTGLVAATVTLVLYLIAIGDLAVSLSGDWDHAPVIQTAPASLWRIRAPYLFEPVLVVHPIPQLAVFVSPVNIALGAVLAALVGCNIAVAANSARTAVSCRRPGYSRALAVLPAFLMGLACCVPTFLLVLGSGVAATLLPLVLPLRPIFYPLALVLLLAVLVSGTRERIPPPSTSPRTVADHGSR